MVKGNIINYKDIVIGLKPHYPNLNEYEIALGCFYKIENFIYNRTSFLGGFAVVSVENEGIPDGVNENCNVITEADFDKYILDICYKLIEQIEFNRVVYREMTYVRLVSCVSCDIVPYMKKDTIKPKVELRDYYIEDISEFCNELRSTLSVNRRQISDVDLYDVVIDNIDYSADRELSIPNTTLKIKIAKSEELMINVIPMGNGKYVLYLFVSKPKFLRRLIKKFKFWKI